MARNCTVCKSKQRQDIDKALVLGRDSFRVLARRFAVGQDSLQRHKARHLPKVLLDITKTRQSLEAGNLLEDISLARSRGEFLYAAAAEILRDAMKDRDRRSSLKAIQTAVDVMGEARSYLELRGVITGELSRARNDSTQPTMVIVLPDSVVASPVIDLPADKEEGVWGKGT